MQLRFTGRGEPGHVLQEKTVATEVRLDGMDVYGRSRTELDQMSGFAPEACTPIEIGPSLLEWSKEQGRQLRRFVLYLKITPVIARDCVDRAAVFRQDDGIRRKIPLFRPNIFPVQQIEKFIPRLVQPVRAQDQDRLEVVGCADPGRDFPAEHLLPSPDKPGGMVEDLPAGSVIFSLIFQAVFLSYGFSQDAVDKAMQPFWQAGFSAVFYRLIDCGGRGDAFEKKELKEADDQ